MRSTELMAINGGDASKWTSGVQAVSRLPGWAKEAQVLVWVDNGNSWRSLSNSSKLNGRVQEYGNLAAAMSTNWEYTFYIPAYP